MGNKLHAPAKSGKVQEFRKVLEDNPKLDPNNRNKSGNTPLHKAAQYGNIEVAELILSHRANVNVNVPNGDNYTPLHIASMKGQTAMVQFLFDNGAKLDALGGAWDSTPLHWAVINNHMETAKLLIKLGADKDIKDGVQRTPLDYLRSESARNELASGVDPTPKPNNESSAAAERQRLREERAALKKVQEKESDSEKIQAEERRREADAAEERRRMLQAAKEKKKVLDAARKRQEEEALKQQQQQQLTLSDEEDSIEQSAIIQNFTPKSSVTPKAKPAAEPSKSPRSPTSEPPLSISKSPQQSASKSETALVVEDDEVRAFDSPEPVKLETKKKPPFSARAAITTEFESDEDDSFEKDDEFENSPVRVVRN